MRYAGLTTAAAVALGTAALLTLGGSRAVALDRVLDKVKQAESVTFVEKQKLGDQGELTMEYAVRGPLVRVEAAGIVFVLDTKQKTGLMLIHPAKAYTKIDKDSPSRIHGAWARISTRTCIAGGSATARNRRSRGGQPNHQASSRTNRLTAPQTAWNR